MSNVSISDLPSAPALGGTELVEIVQAGASFKTTTGDIADVRVITTNDITDMTVFGKGVAMAPSLSNVLDNNIGADQGTLIYRGAASWGALGPGTLGQVLQTRGASQDPVWAATTGVGTVVQVTAGTGLTGGVITSSGTIAWDTTYGDARYLPRTGGTITGNLTVSIAAGAANVVVRGATGFEALTTYATGSSTRWAAGRSLTSESGGNAGSNYEIYGFSDVGAFLGAYVSVNRATGKTTFQTASASGASIRLPQASADPSAPASGDLWVRSTGLKGYINGRVYTFAVDPVTPTLESFTDGVGIGNATADTTAWQLALAQGGAIRILGKTYYLNAGGTSTKRIALIGDHCNKLILTAAFSPSESVCTLKPALGEDFVGWSVSGLDFQPAVDGVGLHAVEIDHTAHAYVSNSELLIEHVTVGAALTLTTYQTVSGAAIHYTPHASDPDGLYCSTIRNCYLVGGIEMTRAGDSLNFENNWIKGLRRGFDIEFVAGAACGRFVGNNIAAQGGALRIKNGFQTEIRTNQIELLAPWSGSSDRGLIVLEDSLSAVIDNNNINGSLLSSDFADCIRLIGTTDRTFITSSNRLVVTAPYVHVNSASTQVPAAIMDRVKWLERPGTTIVADPTLTYVAGTFEGVWSAAVTLINGWLASSLAGALYEGLFYKVMGDGQVRLRGNISGGTNTDNVAVTVLPAIARPLKIQRLTIRCYNGTDYVAAEAAVSPGGSVTFPDALVSNAVVSFDGAIYDLAA